MKFSTVEIKPKACGEDGYDVFFTDLDGDRKDERMLPSALGFYHYPRKMGKKAAFEALRDVMVSAHLRQARLHSETADELIQLDMPK